MGKTLKKIFFSVFFFVFFIEVKQLLSSKSAITSGRSQTKSQSIINCSCNAVSFCCFVWKCGIVGKFGFVWIFKNMILLMIVELLGSGVLLMNLDLGIRLLIRIVLLINVVLLVNLILLYYWKKLGTMVLFVIFSFCWDIGNI